MKVSLADQSLYIDAPREMVFQMLSAIGKGSLPGAQEESSRVLEQRDDALIAEFLTKSGRRTYRTVEEVRLYAPERITFHHLEGPLAASDEEFRLVERDGGTELLYGGEIECRIWWMPWMPWLGRLIALLYVKSKYDSVIRTHMERLKSAAEARASRGHVFRRTEKP